MHLHSLHFHMNREPDCHRCAATYILVVLISVGTISLLVVLTVKSLYLRDILHALIPILPAASASVNLPASANANLHARLDRKFGRAAVGC